MRYALSILLALLAAMPALAQDRYGPAGRDADLESERAGQDELPQSRPTTTPATQPGRVARSTVGQVGQRQTREQPLAGIEPLQRVSSRIQNRVQSRIRNRIDRFYDPQANAASPFEVAEQQARTAGRPTRR